VHAAQERAHHAELLSGAEAAGRIGLRARRILLLEAAARLAGARPGRAAQAVGVERAGQQAVTPWRMVVRATPATKPVRPERAPLLRPRMSIGAFTELEVMFTMRPKPRFIMP
jgi:hypothetical protein